MKKLTLIEIFNRVSFEFGKFVESLESGKLVKFVEFAESFKFVKSVSGELLELFGGFVGVCLTAGQVQGALAYGF